MEELTVTDQDHRTFKRIEVVSNHTSSTVILRIINDPGEVVLSWDLEPPVAVNLAREILAAVERIRETQREGPPDRPN